MTSHRAAVWALVLAAGACLLSGPADAEASPPPSLLETSIDQRGRVLVAVAGRDRGRPRIVRLGGTGQVDASFAGGGTLRPRVDGSAAHFAFQRDGRILVAGGPRRGRAAMRRYRADGRPDRSFGTDGAVRLPVSGVEQLMVQPDGHIVVLATISCSRNSCGFTVNHLVILRYSARGRLISQRIEYSELWSMDAADMEPSGRFVVSGSDWELAYHSFARFLPSGVIDPTLGGWDGLDIPEGEGSGEEIVPNAAALEVQPDGKFVLSVKHSPALMRRNRDGSLDTGFGEGGTVVCEAQPPKTYPPERLSLGAVVALPDNSLLVAGGAGPCGLARYLPNGTLDRSFGDAGKVDVEAQGMARPRSMSVDAVGSLFLAGWDRSTQSVEVARYSASGQLDGGFGSAGFASFAAP
ncbi:MAG TPA: hypothetical protein VIS51_08340 [Solirubrobacterales bacterium]